MKKVKKKLSVILQQTIRRIGKAGDIKQVAKGFAINYLYPKNLAIPFSQKIYDDMQHNKDTLIDKRALENAEKLAKNIEGVYLYMSRSNIVKSNSTEGILYGSISTKDIADELREVIGDNTITKDNIDLNMKIKNTGIYDMKAILYNGVQANFKVSIFSTVEEAKNAVSLFLKDAQKEVKSVG